MLEFHFELSDYVFMKLSLMSDKFLTDFVDPSDQVIRAVL
jgi:hypothetical protein